MPNCTVLVYFLFFTSMYSVKTIQKKIVLLKNDFDEAAKIINFMI